MKHKKIKLSSLSVSSFITAIDSDTKNTIRAGVDTDAHCITELGNTDCGSCTGTPSTNCPSDGTCNGASADCYETWNC